MRHRIQLAEFEQCHRHYLYLQALRLLETRNGGFDEWMLFPVGGAASGDTQPRFNERLQTLYCR